MHKYPVAPHASVGVSPCAPLNGVSRCTAGGVAIYGTLSLYLMICPNVQISRVVVLSAELPL